MERTVTDVGAGKWLVDDEPFQVRHWASETTHPLPKDLSQEVVVGRKPSCGISLDDVHVSNEHARLFHRDKHWRLRDLGTKNRLVADGSSVDEVVLEPGIIVEIGGVTWIVESNRFVALRSFLSRLIGFGADRFADVDQALRAVRRAATGQAPLVLSGDGNLVAIARSIHARVMGDERPFIVCDPRRQRTRATVRSAENYQKALPAMHAAIGGSLCLWSKRVPKDFGHVSIAHREPNARFQLIMCSLEGDDIWPEHVAPVVIPPLSRRTKKELDDIVDDYATDARAVLHVGGGLHALDRQWILRHAGLTHPEIEKGAQRVTAFRATNGNVAGAAAMLRMSHSSLIRWLGERPPLPELPGSDATGGAKR